MIIRNLDGEVIYEDTGREDLRDVDFNGADLRKLDLSANLRGADLSDANLRGEDSRVPDLSMFNLRSSYR